MIRMGTLSFFAFVDLFAFKLPLVLFIVLRERPLDGVETIRSPVTAIFNAV